jgi:hypothetical protein
MHSTGNATFRSFPETKSDYHPPTATSLLRTEIAFQAFIIKPFSSYLVKNYKRQVFRNREVRRSTNMHVDVTGLWPLTAGVRLHDGSREV